MIPSFKQTKFVEENKSYINTYPHAEDKHAAWGEALICRTELVLHIQKGRRLESRQKKKLRHF